VPAADAAAGRVGAQRHEHRDRVHARTAEALESANAPSHAVPPSADSRTAVKDDLVAIDVAQEEGVDRSPILDPRP
jgi:hypothetical protein